MLQPVQTPEFDFAAAFLNGYENESQRNLQRRELANQEAMQALQMAQTRQQMNELERTRVLRDRALAATVTAAENSERRADELHGPAVTVAEAQAGVAGRLATATVRSTEAEANFNEFRAANADDEWAEELRRNRANEALTARGQNFSLQAARYGAGGNSALDALRQYEIEAAQRAGNQQRLINAVAPRLRMPSWGPAPNIRRPVRAGGVLSAPAGRVLRGMLSATGPRGVTTAEAAREQRRADETLARHYRRPALMLDQVWAATVQEARRDRARGGAPLTIEDRLALRNVPAVDAALRQTLVHYAAVQAGEGDLAYLSPERRNALLNRLRQTYNQWGLNIDLELQAAQEAQSGGSAPTRNNE